MSILKRRLDDVFHIRRSDGTEEITASARVTFAID
jgi:hypothetical protein